MIESSFKFKLKKQFHEKLHAQFKKSFEKLTDYDEDEMFYDNHRDFVIKKEKQNEDETEQGNQTKYLMNRNKR